MQNEQKAIMLALSTVLIWSTIASAFKLTLNHFTTSLMVFYSSATAAFVTLLISVITKNNIFKISLKDIKFSLIAGFINPFAYYLILIKAYDILPAQSAQALNYTWGITLSILSFIILKHKPLKRDYAAIIICYLGVFIIATKGNFSFSGNTDIEGVMLALSSTIIWAIYWILNTKDCLSPQKRLFWNFLAGTIYSGIYIIFTDTFEFNIKGVYGSLYIGVFEMGISFFLWLTAMKLTSNASRISNLIYLSPVVSLFMINYFVGEKIMVSTIAGLILILSGILFQNFKRKPD